MRSMNDPTIFGRALFLLVVTSLLWTGCALGGDMLGEGQPMVEFSLEAHDGSTVASDDLDGQAYLLYFYPKADTPG